MVGPVELHTTRGLAGAAEGKEQEGTLNSSFEIASEGKVATSPQRDWELRTVLNISHHIRIIE